MAGKIIADTIQAAGDRITFNVGEVTVMTANSAGLTYIPTANVNLNIANPSSITVGNLTATGNISLTGTLTNGIKFPATQVTSSDANTLDDYEEGTFTPIIYFGGNAVGQTYNYQSGKYVKVGKLVTITGIVGLSNNGSSTGTCTMSVPFVPETTSGHYYSASQGWYNFFPSNITSGIMFDMAANGQNPTLARNGAGVCSTMTKGDWPNTAHFEFSFVYYTN